MPRGAGPRFRVPFGLVACAAWVSTSGCVPVETMSLIKGSPPAPHGLSIEASSVAASTPFLAQRGGAWSIVVTTLVATNRGEDTVEVDVDGATLVISDPGGELPDVVVPVASSGPGSAPNAIPMGDASGLVHVDRGRMDVLWVAFRVSEALDEPGLRRRIVVRVPVSGGGGALEVVLADPARERPRWVLAPVAHASYVGVSAAGTFDEGSVGFLSTSSKSAVGPVVVAPAASLGARAGKLRGERESTIACCDLGLSLDVAFPLLRGSWTSVGPSLGYHAVFALESARVDKATLHGPSAGLTFLSQPIEPRVAGALPVRTSPSLLGYSSFSIAYVHWFRRGDDGGSPGGLLTFERSIPEW